MEGDAVMLLPFLKARIGGADIDMMPNAFSFATVGGQLPNVVVSSAVVQITGISVPVPVTVNAGQFRILDATQTIVIQDWGTFGSIKKGQCLQLRQTSNNAYGGTASIGINVGKASVIWYVTTMSVTGGSASWGTPGTYYFTVPHHNSFNADVYGAAGGGGGCSTSDYYASPPQAGAGGYSYFNAPTGNLVGWGGNGGYFGGDWYDGGLSTGPSGEHGTGANGDGNVYAGGAAPGAGGYMSVVPSWRGGPGGYGGRAYRSWGRGVLVPGSVIEIVVGQGGPPGGVAAPSPQYFVQGGWGNNGAVYVSWG
jgi:hypothetical protein